MGKPEVKNGSDNDFLLIKGIGQATNQILNEVGISTFRDLAGHTPQTLAELLKGSNPSISATRIQSEDWIGQAQRLVRQLMDESSQPYMDWYELADYFASFGYAISKSGEKKLQTKVVHSQSGETGIWDGIAASSMIEWMVSRANMPEIGKVDATIEGEAESVVLELSDLTVSEAGVTPVTDARRLSALIHAESRLRLTASSMNLTYDRTPFCVETYLVDLATSQPALAASYPAQLVPGELEYEITSDFPAPAAGRYQLVLAAQLLPPAEAAARLQGPIIRVVG